jgi:serine/threonine protein kinase
MKLHERDPLDREERLDQIVASYIEELESGVSGDRHAWLVRYPEFYDELIDFFSDRDEVERLATPLRDVASAGERVLALDWLDPPRHPEHLGSLAGYEVVDWLGQGGMGMVFKAFDTGLNRFVAIKVLAPQWAPDSDARRRFTREARAAATISHPHVIAIHAVGVWKARPFIVMEYVPGISLQQRLEAGAPFDLREILQIGMQIAAGLAEAHEQGLVHRDIKPGNIVLENDLARVKITDFGLAKAVDDTLLTRIGTVTGTPRFMAPEQARGERVDRRADLFSLGGVLYALCTGRPAFDGDTTPAVIRQVCDDQPIPVRELNPALPAWLGEIVERSLAKDPDDRFQSAADLADLLARHLAAVQDPTLPPVEHPWVRRPSWRRRLARASRGQRRVMWTLAAFVVAALVVRLIALRAPAPTSAPSLESRASTSRTWQTFDQDFRGGHFNNQRFQRIAPLDLSNAISPEATGLRLRVPAGFGRPIGVATRFGVRGDFEITATFELVPGRPPESGFGMGAELLVKPVGGWQTLASMGRYRRAQDSIYAMSHFVRTGEQSHHEGAFPATRATSATFRLVRVGTLLRYEVADGDSHAYRELFRAEFGSQDVDLIRLAATPGGSPEAVEVLWNRISVKAEKILDADRDYSTPATSDAEE